jgi:hypothetical protein
LCDISDEIPDRRVNQFLRRRDESLEPWLSAPASLNCPPMSY